MYDILQILGFLCLLYIPIGIIFPKLVPFAKSRAKTLIVTVPALLVVAIIGVSFEPAEIAEQRRVEKEQKAKLPLPKQERKKKPHRRLK